MNVRLKGRWLHLGQLHPVLFLLLDTLILHLIVIVDEADIPAVLPLRVLLPCPILHPHGSIRLLLLRVNGIGICFPAGCILEHLYLLGQHQAALVLVLLPLAMALGIVLPLLVIVSAVAFLLLVQVLVRIGNQLATRRTRLFQQIMPGRHPLSQLGASSLESESGVGKVWKAGGLAGERDNDAGHT